MRAKFKTMTMADHAALDEAEHRFAYDPSPAVAGKYLAVLIELMNEDLIEDDRFFGHLCEIRDYLEKQA